MANPALLNRLVERSDFGALGVKKVKTRWSVYKRGDGEYVVGALVGEAKTVANAAYWLKERNIITSHCAVVFMPSEEDEIKNGAERAYMIALELPDIDEAWLKIVNDGFAPQKTRGHMPGQP